MKPTEPPRRPPQPGWTLRHALRIAFIARAEDESRRRLGRALTDAELRALLPRYRGE